MILYSALERALLQTIRKKRFFFIHAVPVEIRLGTHIRLVSLFDVPRQ